MTKVQIHGFAPSTYTRTACMAAIEKGIDHELVPIEYGKPSHFALHPFGKMPILTQGDLRLFETLSIVTYIDEIGDNSSLFGSIAEQRARIFGAISVAIDYAYRPVVHIDTNAGVATPEDLAVAAKPLNWLEAELANAAHIVGDRLSAADLFFAPMVAYHAAQVGDDVAYADRPRIAAWMAEIAKRPSFSTTGA